MARKKGKKSGRSRSRSRRIGAAGGFDIMNPLMAAVGGAAGGFINKLIPDDSTIDPKIIAGGKMVLGAVMPMMFKDAKTKAMMTAAGNGLVAVGTVELLQEMGVVSGYQGAIEKFDEKFDLAVEIPSRSEMQKISDDILNDDVLNDDDLNVINEGDDDLNVINDDDMLDEY